MLISSHKIHILVLAMLCASFNAYAQEESDTIQIEEKIFQVDTLHQELTKKEKRKADFQYKLANSGKFFSHEDRPGRKAGLYALATPGLGQIYNRKYWKLPIVYGAMGTTLFFTVYNGKRLKRYNVALGRELRDEPHEFTGILSESEIIRGRNFFRKKMELNALLTAVMYGLSIIDAVVDAHLFKFDISDDLTFEWYPNFLTGNNRVIPALNLSLTFN